MTRLAAAWMQLYRVSLEGYHMHGRQLLRYQNHKIPQIIEGIVHHELSTPSFRAAIPLGHKLRIFSLREVQFVTGGIIYVIRDLLIILQRPHI